MASPTEPVRPGHRRGLSFHSGKSGKSSSHQSSASKPKVEVKENNRFHTHADPTLAMSEMQPSAMAHESSTMLSLRGVQHKDRFGNLIIEPDLSNPTRHRFERPLDTIRSFHAAIDGTYNQRRQSYIRPDESMQGGQSRPDSYVGGGDRSVVSHNHRGHNDMNGNYGRGNQSRPDSYADAYGGHHGQHQAPRGQRYNQRQNGDYHGAGHQGYIPQHPGYPPNGVNGSPSVSGSGNLSADQLAQSTDPSSVNSSMDRLQHRQKPEGQPLTEAYGFNGFGADPQLDYQQQYHSQDHPDNYSMQQEYQQGPNYDTPAPAPPPKGPTTLQKGKAVLKEEKRKSFFKRFSKS